ncbi:MAG: hypothetical protein IJ837_01290 [Clostridia bacterium]|nr:hypothetical protein [Clostridia bacterium]
MEIKEADVDFLEDIETLIQKIELEPVDKDVHIIILKIHNPALLTDEKSYNLNLMGKKMIDWVKLAFSGNITEIETDMKSDIISTIKPHLTENKYTAIFYADTPLLDRKTFLNIMDYMQIKRFEALKLERGYVFLTDYLKNSEHLQSINSCDLFKENFLTVFNMNQLELANQILKNKIISSHQQKGVLIVDKNSTYIESDVKIGKNVIIYPNNAIMGESEIGDNVVIEPFCTIKSSKIHKNSVLKNCYIENSEIKEKSNIKPFSYILNGVKK